MSELKLEITEYRIVEEGCDIRRSSKVVRRYQPDGTSRWTILDWLGDVLNKKGEWEYEPQPSSRSDAFYERTRFDTIEEVLAVYEKAGRRG